MTAAPQTAPAFSPEVADLFTQIRQWVKMETPYHLRVFEDRVRTDPYGRDPARDVWGLIIETVQKQRIHLEPLGGRKDRRMVVEMYAWPTLVRVRLVHDPEKQVWDVTTDTDVPFQWNLDRAHFFSLVHDLLAA